MLVWLLLAEHTAVAQVTQPAVSPYAKVSEQVGLSDITITYGRPGVNGRNVYGGIVPYGLSNPIPNFGSGNPFPWRAGANENTVITFEDDMLVQGKPLASGSYGLHMIPSESDWTVIFSNNSTSWGSFFYDQSDDALRVTVSPVEIPHQERLVYEFTDHQGLGGVTLEMKWANLKVPIQLEVADVANVIVGHMRNELRSRGGFTWQGYAQASAFALQNDVNLEEALQWAEQAVQGNETFNTLRVKAGLLAKLNRASEADAIMENAMATANENQLNAYGYQLMGQNNMPKAFEIFTLNIERHPESWNPLDSLGEYYANMGDTQNAIKYYKMALDKLPANDTANKSRINGILAGLDNGSN
jgi:hypothetical protein